MNSFTNTVIKHKKAVLAVFIAAALISAVLFLGVRVNYDIVDYLPDEAESTTAINNMYSEFSSDVPNTRVMVPDVTLTEALEYKARISEVKGVSDVIWLDDLVDLKKPIEMADTNIVEQYYKDGAALFSVTIEDGNETEALAELYKIIGDDGAVTGAAASHAIMQNMASRETMGAMAILLPIIILLLLLTTASWIAPLLFLTTIGVAVLINIGTNVFFSDISFITQAVSPILQLAVSLDYAIFLLNSFERFRNETDDVDEAMRRAVKHSRSSIAASAATTLFGFLALIFMRFKIGSNLGLNLFKGVALSYISVMIFLPALVLSTYKLVDKTRHKRIIPDFSNIGKGLLKVRLPAIMLVVILVVPCFLAQKSADFIYGAGDPDPATRFGVDTVKTDETFGQSSATVLLVPRGDSGREAELCSDLEDIEYVTGVVSYVASVGSSIPDEFLDGDTVSNFYSDNYARIVIYADTGDEGEDAFGVVKAIRETATEYYDESWVCGQSASLYDIKSVVTDDSLKVNLIAIAFIFLTLLVTFRSLTLPFILLFVIESAIWINLSVPYFTDVPLVYVGYLIINTVQLGATIDYAILITDGYRKYRVFMGKREAVTKSLGDNFISVLTSALILSSAGFCLNFESSVQIVSEMGLLLGRGTLLSLTQVLLVLPGLLIIFDRITAKLTLRADFLKMEGK